LSVANTPESIARHPDNRKARQAGRLSGCPDVRLSGCPDVRLSLKIIIIYLTAHYFEEPIKKDKEGNLKADPHTCEKINCPVCRIFGTPAEKSAPKGPTRVIIRDAYPDDKTQEIFEEIELKKGLPKTELKWEVSIDRVTSKPPYGPRMIERVPKGSVFDLNIIFGLYDIDDNLADLNYLKYLFSALGMVEDSFLGGSGSRGSGRVSFKIEKLLLKTPEFYTGKDAYEILSQDLPTNPQDIDYKKIVEEIRQKI